MTKEEKLIVCVKRAAELMVDNGLGDWKISLNNKTSALATTHYIPRTIFFSKHFLTIATKEDLEGITLHEVTHALLGYKAGHGKDFKEKCTELVGNDKYSHPNGPLTLKKYIYECPNCEGKYSKNKKQVLYCDACAGDSGHYVQLNVRENIIEVVPWASTP